MGKPITVAAQTGNKTHGHPRGVASSSKPTCWRVKETLGQAWGGNLQKFMNGMNNSACVFQREHRCTHELMYVQKNVWKNYILKDMKKLAFLKGDFIFFLKFFNIYCMRVLVYGCVCVGGCAHALQNTSMEVKEQLLGTGFGSAFLLC